MYVTLLDAVSADGAGTALDVRGAETAAVHVEITGEAVVNWEGSYDGSNWFSVSGTFGPLPNPQSSLYRSQDGFWFDVRRLAYLRPTVTGYKRGTVTVKGYCKMGAQYTHYSAAATELIKTGPGVLRGVHIGDAGTNMVVTLYDGTDDTGTVIGAYKVAGSWPLGVEFSAGLYAVITADTPGDVTVVWD